jgi:hypothetical protein
VREQVLRRPTLLDGLDRLGEAVFIARRSRAIAAQSVVGGIGLSMAAMHVILLLHNAQEEESYLSLADESAATTASLRG